MRYAKLIAGEISFAPRKLRSGDTVVYNPPVALLLEQGYKPVRFTEAPGAEEGFRPVSGWTESETEILQTWTMEPEDEISDNEALEILLGGNGL